MKAILWVTLFALAACDQSTESGDRVDTAELVSIYYNGNILTMDDRQQTVQAIAVRQGIIVSVGDEIELRAQFENALTEVDLDGRTLMPGFFDSHSHATLSAAKWAVVNLDPPPAGPADSIAAIKQALQQSLASTVPTAGKWLVGWGYDHAMLAEQRHPSRYDLDEVSSEIPIMLIHFSAHQIVLNSKGLELSGIKAETPNPLGGSIGRVANSDTPNGILQENAMLNVALPILNRLILGHNEQTAPTLEAIQRMQRAQEEYLRQGFTTITEMGATRTSMNLLYTMAEQGLLTVDVIAAALSKAYKTEQVSKLVSASYKNRLRVGGSKIILDGGSPGRSAFLRHPYFVQLEGEEDYRGYPHIEQQSVLNELLQSNFEYDIPVYIHALGDAAVDQAIAGLKSAQKMFPDSASKAQLIHVQQIQEDQLETLKSMDTSITFQVAHNYYFGDFHRETIYGPERTSRLNPARSALAHGISVSIHHDSPVHPIDQFILIWAAVNRVSRSGQVSGPDQRMSVWEALRASTLEAAKQFDEADRKGSIEVGKLADLIILSDNPLTIDPMRLREITVLQTIKEGKTAYLQ